MKKSAVFTAALIVCLLVLGIGAWSMFGQNVGLTYANADQYTAGDATLTDPVENLDISWTAGYINIAYHAGNEILISETARETIPEDLRMMWWLDGTTLRVRYEKPGLHLRVFNTLQKTLTVTLPEGTVLKDASIAATSADMNIPALTADRVTLSLTSGDIKAALAARELTSSTTSGDQEIRLSGETETVSVTSTSGNIGLTLEQAKAINEHSTSGGLSLTVSGRADDVRMAATSGNVYADVRRMGKADIGATSGTVNVKAGELETLHIGTASGDVTAVLPAEPGFTCEVSTASGSFNSGIALEKKGSVYTCGDGSAQCKIGTASGDIRIEPFTAE